MRESGNSGIRWVVAVALLAGLTLLAAYIANEIPGTEVSVATNETPVASATPSGPPATPRVARAREVIKPTPRVARAVPVFTPSPTPSPTPIVTRSSDPLSPVVLPLDALSPQAGDLARSSGLASFSAIVLIPGEGVAYQFNGDKASPLMSVAKIPIMLTLMDKAIDEKRELTPYENALLGKMIRQSDNNAADAIWSIIGASTGMNRFLESVGLPALVSHEERWGETLASPMHTSMLVGMLIDGRILNEPMRGKAMTLLGDIDPSQDWGALAGLTVSAQTGIKNGWFPESYGWVLNSTAFVLPSDSPAYVIAVFTTGARRYYDGVALIEQFATAVNSAMAQRR